MGTYFVDFIAMIFGMPLALFPALAGRLGGPRVLGMLYAAPAVGALVASLTARWTPRVSRHGLAVMLAATGWGIAIVAFGFCDTLWPALFFLALAGGADAISGIFRMTMWNQTIPDALRGRMAGIEMVSYLSGPLLGHVEAGAVAARVGRARVGRVGRGAVRRGRAGLRRAAAAVHRATTRVGRHDPASIGSPRPPKTSGPKVTISEIIPSSIRRTSTAIAR